MTKALSAKTPAFPVAQSALDNNMNALKTDMRTLSKALSVNASLKLKKLVVDSGLDKHGGLVRRRP